MYDFVTYDEKAAYDRRRHRRASSSASRGSDMSRSSSGSSTYTSDATYEETKPPPYVNLFYNTFDDKAGSPKRRVRFALDKSEHAPLPRPKEDERELVQRKPIRSPSRDGEYAWWTKRLDMDDREYDRRASTRRY